MCCSFCLCRCNFSYFRFEFLGTIIINYQLSNIGIDLLSGFTSIKLSKGIESLPEMGQKEFVIINAMFKSLFLIKETESV